MEVDQVLHMNGGKGDTSYASNSLVQQKVISKTKPITEEAISNLFCASFPTTLTIADLGCSSGPNTFLVVSDVVEVVEKICQKLGKNPPEYQVFLNDLPGNDFNTIFRSLSSFRQDLRNKLGPGIGPCFVAGVPGSFYGRIFSSRSVDFVHSSYSLMWLSRVPEGVEGNKGNIYTASTSPPSVPKAYYGQFQKDFSQFLRCRAQEVVTGGSMVLTFLGRRSEDPTSKECCYIWELMAMVLNDMICEGLIEEEKMDSFNIPQYTPSPAEVKLEVEKEGSFTVNRLEVSEVNWDGCDIDLSKRASDDAGVDGSYNVAKCMRAVAEPLLVSHFGEDIIDEVFERYRNLIADRMAKEKTVFVNVVVSLTKTVL